MPPKAKKDLKPGDALPGPDRKPKHGDTVNYIFHEHAGTVHQEKIYPALVKVVHEGHEGRLINVEVETPKETLRLGPVSYREHDESAPAGNTWHWPEEPETKAEPETKKPKQI